MSEQRFVLDKLYYTIMTPIEKISVGRCYMTYMEVVDTLNEQQATIEEQNKEIEEWEFSFRTEMAHHRVAEKELKEKIREQQATIEGLKEKLDDVLELTEFVGMTSLRKAEIKSIVNR